MLRSYKLSKKRSLTKSSLVNNKKTKTKTTVCEKRKIRIFPKGLVHRFGQKFEISSTLIFYAK